MLNVYYLAYGSNLHPLRLQARAPSAIARAFVPMPGHRLTFHKRSKDGSGKCNLLQDKSSQAYGVLYEMTSMDMEELHKHEGPGYIRQQVKVELQDEAYVALIYVAKSESTSGSLAPYDWYRDMVVVGAEHYDFPQDYVASIRATASWTDLDVMRSTSNKVFLQRMAQHPPLVTALPSSTNVVLAASQ